MLNPDAFFIGQATSTNQRQHRTRMTRAILMDARNSQRSAIVWLVVSIVQIMIFAYALGIPSVQTQVQAEPGWLIPPLIFVTGAAVYIACFTRIYDHYQHIIDRARGVC